MSHLWLQFFSKEGTLMHKLHLFMKEKSHSNVTFLITAVLIRRTWMHTLHQFIRLKSCSNVTFMITAVLKREKINRHFQLQLFMKEWNYSNATFATTATQKSDRMKHFASVHEGEKPFKCGICNCSCYQKCHLIIHVAWCMCSWKKETGQMWHKGLQLFSN